MRSFQNQESYIRKNHQYPGLTWEKTLRKNDQGEEHQMVSVIILDGYDATKLLAQINENESAANKTAYGVVKSRFQPGYRVVVNLDEINDLQPKAQASYSESSSLSSVFKALTLGNVQNNASQLNQPFASLSLVDKPAAPSSEARSSSSQSLSTDPNINQAVKLPRLK